MIFLWYKKSLNFDKNSLYWQEFLQFRSRYSKVFYWKDVMKLFAKFLQKQASSFQWSSRTLKDICHRLFMEFSESFKNSYFHSIPLNSCYYSICFIKNITKIIIESQYTQFDRSTLLRWLHFQLFLKWLQSKENEKSWLMVALKS